VSTPPSSGLAAALSWSSPALSWPSPGASARFLLQRRRKKKPVRFFFFFRAGGSLSPTNGVFFLFSFFPVPFLPHSDARELGLGFGNGVFTVFFWLVHPNGIRVRVSVCRLLFFSPSPFGFDFFLLSFLLTRSPEKGI